MNWYLIVPLYALCGIEAMVLVRKGEHRWIPKKEHLGNAHLLLLALIWPFVAIVFVLTGLFGGIVKLVDYMAKPREGKE